MADSFAVYEMLLREEFGPATIDLTLENDDVIWQIMRTLAAKSTAGRMTNRAGSSDENTPGWECSWPIRIQRGGRVTGGKFGRSEILMMGPNSDRAMGQTATDLYLDPTKTPKRSSLNVKMKLKRFKGQIVINRDEIEADMAANPVEDIAFNQIEDAVYQLRRMITAHAWADGTASLAQVDGSGHTIYAAAGSVTAANSFPLKTGTGMRFVEGQRYVIGTDADPRVQRGSALRCVEIDNDGRPWFQVEPGGSNISLTDGDHIMVEENYDFNAASVAAGSLAINGIESLLRNSGNFPGTGHDVAKVLKLQSFITDTESSRVLPTPEEFAVIPDQMTHLGIMPPPVAIAQQELWTYAAQLERQSGATYPVPQGAAFTASGGVDGPVLSHAGRTFARLSSAQCRPGAVHGLDPNSFMKFTPLGDRTIKWAASGGPMSGQPSMFLPIRNGNRLTGDSSADFDAFFEMGCENPRLNYRRLGYETTLTAAA